jgi:putative hemolysin
MTPLFIVLGLLLLHGIAAGSEIAVVNVRKTRLRQLAEEGSGAAKAVMLLRTVPERFMATLQIAITVLGNLLVFVGIPAVAAVAGGVISHVDILSPWHAAIGSAVGLAVISYLELVLGELVPKSLALRASEPYALIIARPLLALSKLGKPAVWVLEASSNLVLRVFGDRTSFMESRLSPEEMRQLLEEAGRTGSIEPGVSEIAVRSLEMSGLTAADVMVPRNRVVALDQASTADDVRKAFLEKGHQRLPVYRDSLDNVLGYIAAKDVLQMSLEKTTLSIEELMRPAVFFPEAMKAVKVLKEMQEKHQKIAVMVDERGGMAGIVTMEDLLEELVGDIYSEDDRGAPTPVRIRLDGSAYVQGNAPIREVNRALGTSLPEGELWATIAGYCIALAGHIPAPGERVVAEDGTILEILESTPKRIRNVHVIKPQRTELEADGAS